MRASLATRIVCAVAAGFVPMVLYALENGPDPRHTGAPGDLTCAKAGCHAGFFTPGQVNFHGGSVTATFSRGVYTPGDPLTITVKVTDPTNSGTYGFQMTARLEPDLAATPAGRFEPTPNSSVVVICSVGEEGQPRLPGQNCPQSGPIEFIEHNNPSSTGTWTFQWVPPATGSGKVHFYVAANAANGNGDNDINDHIYTAEYVLEQGGGCVEGVPTLTSVEQAVGFGKAQGFAPNSWLEIKGANLSTITREWTGQEFSGTVAPIVNDKVSVKVNGKDAAVWYISPTQVNVNTPDNEGTGPMDVVLKNCEQTSGPISLEQKRTAPGMLAHDAWVFNGKQYMVALFANEYVFVGNIPLQVVSRPAKTGDVIVIYGIGFGDTNPKIPAGTYTNGLAPLVAPVSIVVGGVPVPAEDIFYAGMSPQSVGLYQFIFEMPALPDGDHVVEVRLDGVLVPPVASLTVQNPQ